MYEIYKRSTLVDVLSPGEFLERAKSLVGMLYTIHFCDDNLWFHLDLDTMESVPYLRFILIEEPSYACIESD